MKNLEKCVTCGEVLLPNYSKTMIFCKTCKIAPCCAMRSFIHFKDTHPEVWNKFMRNQLCSFNDELTNASLR